MVSVHTFFVDRTNFNGKVSELIMICINYCIYDNTAIKLKNVIKFDHENYNGSVTLKITLASTPVDINALFILSALL